MAKFNETNEGLAFIASGSNRETSPEIMEAIAFFASNIDEANDLWSGDALGFVASPVDIWEHITRNGLRNASDYVWGAAGSEWADAIGISA